MAHHILLIDGNSIAHACHNSPVLTVGDMQVQAVFGFLRSLHGLLEHTPGRVQPIVLWDGRAQWRLDLFPAYKGNRKPLDAKQKAKKEAFKRQSPFIEKALQLLGVRQIRSPLLEADDLAGRLAPRLVQLGRQVTLVSGDRDWLQLVGESVTWLDPIRERKVDPDNFFEFTGFFTPEAFVQGKALQGDSSDNVPGVGGIGEKGAREFLAKWGSVEQFFQQYDAGAIPDKELKKAHHNLASPEGRAAFERNLRLMDLRRSRKPEPDELVTDLGQPNPDGFLLLCERLAFASILRDPARFLRPFGLQPPGHALAA